MGRSERSSPFSFLGQRAKRGDPLLGFLRHLRGGLVDIGLIVRVAIPIFHFRARCGRAQDDALGTEIVPAIWIPGHAQFLLLQNASGNEHPGIGPHLHRESIARFGERLGFLGVGGRKAGQHAESADGGDG